MTLLKFTSGCGTDRLSVAAGDAGKVEANEYALPATVGAAARFFHGSSCDGLRMPAPLAKFATRTMAGGPAFESCQGRKPREMGTPIGGRYGDFAGADGVAQVLEREAGFEEMPGRLHGGCLARATRRACVMIAGGNQRE